MSAIQLSFSLRVSSGVKTVHLLGSWDSYVGQLPLSKDKTSSKGTWKGTFRFQGTTLEPGQRYWYYYIIDGYHVSHNPSEASTVEPTTGRELNILDVPKSKSSSRDSKDHKSSKSSSRHSSAKDKDKKSSRDKKRPSTLDVAKGRPLSTSQIQAPKPMSPHATRHILNDDYDYDELADHFAVVGVDDYDDGAMASGFDSASPLSSSDSDLSYRSDNSSPSSAMSGYSTPGSDVSSCTCERYGITRKGERVRLDCGGKRCGYDESCSSASSSDDESGVGGGGGGGNGYGTRRQGIVVRA